VRALDRVIDRFDRFQQRTPAIGFPLAVVKKFSDDQAGRLAAVTAYYAFFSMFPLLIVFVTILGMVLRNNPDLQASLVNSVLAQFPVIGDQLRTNIHSLTGGGVALTVSILVTLWAGLGAVRAGQASMDAVWNVPRKERPPFLKGLVRALALLGVLGAFVLLTTAMAGLATAGGAFGVLVKIAGIAGALVLNFGAFTLAFRLLTSAKVSWGNVIPGAIVAAIAWEGLQLGGAYIVGHQIKGASQTYGTFAFVIALLSWIYLGAQVTLYAAEINVVRARRLWPRPLRDQPADVGMRSIGGSDMQEQKKPGTSNGGSAEQRSTVQLVKSIAADTGTLVKKEVELAKQEILEAIVARAKAAGAFGAAGVFGLVGLLCGCAAGIAGLSTVMSVWLAALIVMGSLFVLAGLAAAFAVLRIKTSSSIAPTETVRTVKEDVEWARAQLKR
jgi:YihY family inner membrane protein